MQSLGLSKVESLSRVTELVDGRAETELSLCQEGPYAEEDVALLIFHWTTQSNSAEVPPQPRQGTGAQGQGGTWPVTSWESS